MKSMTLEAFGPGSPFIKAMLLMEAKGGKTTFLVMSLLGLWPWQQKGGVVSDPAHLHVIAVDQDCLDRITKLMVLAGVPEKTIAYVVSRLDVVPMRDDVKKVMDTASPYNHSFLNALKVGRQEIAGKVKAKTETHAVLLSSVTTTLKINERALFGEPTGISGGKGYGSKDLWTLLQGQAAEIQNMFQVDLWHFWAEGHVFKTAKQDGSTEDSLQIHGSGRNWPVNTSHNFRVVRETTAWKDAAGKATAIYPMYLDLKPSFSFLPTGGRGTAGAPEKAYDLTALMADMGYQCGFWGAP
jgi:hypothetical protein